LKVFHLVLHCSKIWWIIGQIFAVDGGTPKFKIVKLGLKKAETSFYLWFKAYFDTLNHLGVDHEEYNRQIIGETDILTANATFLCAANSQIKNCKWLTSCADYLEFVSSQRAIMCQVGG